jgi:hypothetical protein
MRWPERSSVRPRHVSPAGRPAKRSRNRKKAAKRRIWRSPLRPRAAGSAAAERRKRMAMTVRKVRRSRREPVAGKARDRYAHPAPERTPSPARRREGGPLSSRAWP